MRRRLLLIVLLALLAGGVVWWKCRSNAQPDDVDGVGGGRATTSSTSSRRLPDPKTLVRGSLAGTVRDERGAPVAAATVCASGRASELPDDLLREPSCATTDAGGAYVIANLFPARYLAGASAKRYRPGIHTRDGLRDVVLAAGERRTGIDITLRDGGVEIAGTVSDLTGGPVAKARVWATAWGNLGTPVFVPAEADEKGAFSLWVEPGDVLVRATADGYADDSDEVEATARVARRVELVLTPEASLSGRVVDATTGEPIAGARVLVGTSDWGWDDGERTFSDDRGEFRIARLTPRRYVVTAHTEHGFGRSEGSHLVGLAQHVDGVVVKLHPARRITGRVVIAGENRDCESPGVSLRDSSVARFVDLSRATDGSLFADGVRDGHYEVEAVYCRGYVSRESYPPVVTAGKDALDLVWEVDRGATLRGRVTTKSGAPVGDAVIRASTTRETRGKDGYGAAKSDATGRYTITGLRPGTYEVEVSSERGTGRAIELEIAAGTTIDKDLAVEDGGTLSGTVVDATGKPVGGAEVRAVGSGRSGSEATADPAGAFSIAPLAAGDYRITVARADGEPLRKPGTTDDTKQAERAAIIAGQTTTIAIVVERSSEQITGTVVDAAGKPVGDAFVSAARESDAAGATRSAAPATRWSWSNRPVLTSTEGAFTLVALATGTYTIRAYRRGGGEAIVEHVKTGGTARLQIKATGSIAGRVTRAGGPPDELAIALRDPTTGYRRRETFFKTGGAFAIADLPAGKLTLSVESAGGSKLLDIELGVGEHKAGIALELEPLVTVTGRLVEYGTQTPVTDIRMMVRSLRGSGMYAFVDDPENISDAAGRFTVKQVPQGQVTIASWRAEDRGYARVSAVRTITGTGTVDIGDVPVMKRRLGKGDEPGELGIKFAEFAPDTPVDKRELKVSFIDPHGPAAATELRVGDVVATIDGVDARGTNLGLAFSLLAAPPGTKIALGLARGPTVTITLAAP